MLIHDYAKQFITTVDHIGSRIGGGLVYKTFCPCRYLHGIRTTILRATFEKTNNSRHDNTHISYTHRRRTVGQKTS